MPMSQGQTQPLVLSLMVVQRNLLVQRNLFSCPSHKSPTHNSRFHQSLALGLQAYPESRGSVSSFLFPLLQPGMLEPAALFTSSETLGSMTSSLPIRFLIPQSRHNVKISLPKLPYRSLGLRDVPSTLRGSQ